MFSKRFEKKAFKAAVKDNVKTLYRKTIDEATPQQLFQAVSYAVKDVIIDDWIETQKDMMRQTLRQYTICQWSSLWDVHLATTSSI